MKRWVCPECAGRRDIQFNTNTKELLPGFPSMKNKMPLLPLKPSAWAAPRSKPRRPSQGLRGRSGCPWGEYTQHAEGALLVLNRTNNLIWSLKRLYSNGLRWFQWGNWFFCTVDPTISKNAHRKRWRNPAEIKHWQNAQQDTSPFASHGYIKQK